MTSPTALRSPAAFAALRRDGRRARRGTITVTWVPADLAASPAMASRVEIAFAVGRRAGGAVARNRIRRRLRAVVHEIGGGTAGGGGGGLVPGAYLFGAGPEAATIPYEELRRTVTEALRTVTSR